MSHIQREYTKPEMRDLQILAPTWIEYWAARRTLPHMHISRTGISLVRWQGASQGTAVIVCGLAGGLSPDLAPGTILVPAWVGLTNGNRVQCDPALVEMLTAGARHLRLPLDTGPMLTSQTLVVGDERHLWLQKGFVAADMETGLLAGRNLRLATLRVVLDTPEHDLPADLLRPARAVSHLSRWHQLFWLSRVAPRYALLAARVLKAGLNLEPNVD